jgi:hypothetical protein
MACINFTLTYPAFMWHAILLSITSATGQMFIFYTLSTYGALVFTIIMTYVLVVALPGVAPGASRPGSPRCRSYVVHFETSLPAAWNST